MWSLRALVAALAVALAAPVALAQDDENLTEPSLPGEESVEGASGIAFYVVVAVMSIAVFVGLAVLTSRYYARRGSRPPPK